ncbi:hypothetical protein GYH30_012209 [Glycine max]|nr:hypothetical protein GYH30_012209 [Glycine max]
MSISAAAFRVAQSSLLNASTKQGIKLFNCAGSDAPPAATILSTSVNSTGFTLKSSRFKSFLNLDRSFDSLVRSRSEALSIVEARHSTTLACVFWSCSVNSAFTNDFRIYGTG